MTPLLQKSVEATKGKGLVPKPLGADVNKKLVEPAKSKQLPEDLNDSELPKGWEPPRKQTPSIGYHVINNSHSLATLKSIAKEGLKPQSAEAGDNGVATIPGVYMYDDLFPSGHPTAMEVDTPKNITLKVKIPKGSKAFDDSEVRTYTNHQDPNSNIGPESAFVVRKPIPPENLSIILPNTRKEVPLLEFLKDK
jgi:hypothetical protein